MATTSPDNLRTPDPGDNYNLVVDLQTLASDVQSALTLRANAYKGTNAARTAFTASAALGTLWQDTDGMGMLWKKGATDWSPAVWAWSGSSAERIAFSAPDGFIWSDTTDQRKYIRLSSVWRGDSPLVGEATLTSTGGAAATTTVTFPAGYFANTPSVQVSLNGGMNASVTINYGPSNITATGFTLNMARSSTTNTTLYWQASRVP